MSQKHPRGRLLILGAFLCSVAFGPQRPLWSQEVADAPAKLGPAPNPLPPELEQEVALQATISLEARRMPLGELLAEVQKQSGLKITMAEGAPVRSLVTARLSGMTVSKVMSALSRIYDVRWSKQGDGYLMRPTDKDALGLQLMRQSGLSEKFETIEDLQEKRRQADAIAEEIYNSVDEERWKAPEGVLIASLPQEEQQKIVAMFKSQSDEAETWTERTERLLASQKLVLRLHLPTEEEAKRIGALRPDSGANADRESAMFWKRPGLFVYTADGLHLVTTIYPGFRGPRIEPPDPKREAQMEDLRRRFPNLSLPRDGQPNPNANAPITVPAAK